MNRAAVTPGNLADMRRYVQHAVSSVCFRDVQPLGHLTMQYYLETVALVFRGVALDADHQSDIVCYKAMDRLEWEACVERVGRLTQEIEQQRRALRQQYQAQRSQTRQAGQREPKRPKFPRVPCIQFDYDGGEHDMDLPSVLKWTTVKSDARLVRALEMISPYHLGSDIDVFDALKRALATKKSVDGVLPRRDVVAPDKEEEPVTPSRWDRHWKNHPCFGNNGRREPESDDKDNN